MLSKTYLPYRHPSHIPASNVFIEISFIIKCSRHIRDCWGLPVADVTESKSALLLILKPQSDGLFEIRICENLRKEFVDEHHQIQRQSRLSLHQNHCHAVHFANEFWNFDAKTKS